MAIKVSGTTVIDDSRNIVNVKTITLDSNTATLDVTGDMDISGDLIVEGDLTVNGNTTTYNTTNLEIEDNIIHIAANNNADTVDFGLVGHYYDGSSNNHAGIFRDATDGKWYAFDQYTADELVGSTINRGDASFSLATFVVDTFEASAYKDSSGRTLKILDASNNVVWGD